jgi:hypothetical protein
VSAHDFDHVWYWHPKPWRSINRKGERCRVLARGKKNTIAVEFEDGFKVLTARFAVRKAA